MSSFWFLVLMCSYWRLGFGRRILPRVCEDEVLFWFNVVFSGLNRMLNFLNLV